MANTKISALTADTAPTADDLVVTVNDPGGTPATRKATVTNFTKAIPAVIGDSGAGGTKGLVPAPAAGDAAANKFLHADGTFKTPTGSGSIGGSSGGTDNAIIRADGTGGSTVQSSTITIDDTGAVTVPEMAAPATPAAGKVAIYAKTDGKLYIKDDAGAETDLTASGGSATEAATTWAFSGDITPTALSADQNNYNPTGLATSAVLRLRADTTNRNITGLAGGADGRVIIITNIGTPGTHFDVILKHESASSTDTNRFYNAGNLQSDLRIRPRQGVILWYDASEGTGRWKVLTGSINGDNLYAWIGSTAFPSYSFATKETYGIYHDGNNCIPIVVGGTDKYGFNTSSFLVKAGQSLGFANSGLGATGCTAGFRSPVSGQIAVVDQDSNTIAATIYAPTRTMNAPAGVPTPNLAQGNVQRHTMAASITVAAPTGMVDGIEFTLIFIQSTGSHTAAWNAVYKWAGGVAPTLSTAAGAVDIFRFWTNGTNVYELSRALDVK